MTVAAPETRITVIMSRRRPLNMAHMFRCFPDAYVCVEDSEERDYKAFVPDGRLVLHPPMTGSAEVRNWMIDHFQEDCIFQVDDDFRRIQCYCNADIREVSAGPGAGAARARPVPGQMWQGHVQSRRRCEKLRTGPCAAACDGHRDLEGEAGADPGARQQRESGAGRDA